MEATQAGNYDMSRFGMELNRASPRQADLMNLAGRVSRKMAPVVHELYDQMAEPKWVIMMGAYAAVGCNFNNYAGCLPRLEQLIHGILPCTKKILTEYVNL
ncbi:MAG: hypothetical protein RLP44_18525 [Aggregatilineales bacterium]